MTKPTKSTLCPELEKHLKSADYSSPTEWSWELKTTYVVDVMGHTHKVNFIQCKTFGQYVTSYLTQVDKLCLNAESIHLVFDTYCEGPVKDSERSRRNTTLAVEISAIDTETLFPADMTSFWGSNSNKEKLQMLIRNAIMPDPTQLSTTKIFLSGIGIDEESRMPCQTETGVIIDELQYDIEEADERLILHIMYAARKGSERIVVLSNDTDVLVLTLHNTDRFKRKGMKELWQRAGVANTSRFIPIPVLSAKLGPNVCRVLPALHILTGCGATSKVGTKPASMKANPVPWQILARCITLECGGCQF